MHITTGVFVDRLFVNFSKYIPWCSKLRTIIDLHVLSCSKFSMHEHCTCIVDEAKRRIGALKGRGGS